MTANIDNDKARWDAKYKAGEYGQRTHPSAYLEDHRDKLLALDGRKAADLACGRGRNSWYLASLGFTVDAYDVSSVGLALAREADYGYREVDGDDLSTKVSWRERDLLRNGLPAGEEYDLIIMFRFVAMDLLQNVATWLAPNGLIIVEEHLQYRHQDGASDAVVGPRSDRFRVAPGALQNALSDLRALDFFEGLVRDPDGEQAALARMIAQKS